MIFLRRSGIHLTDEYWEIRMRKYVIVGTGGTGGEVGGYLAKAGMDVTFIARGKHLEAIKKNGLKILRPQDDLKNKQDMGE